MSEQRLREHGFTLIEVLVSFVILAFAMAVLLPLFSDNGTLVHRALHERRAVQLAQSLLESVGNIEPLTAGEKSGQLEDEYSWVISVAKSPAIPADNPMRLSTYVINVKVSWGDRQSVSLRTLRIGATE